MYIISVQLKALAESYLHQGHSQKALSIYIDLLAETTDPTEMLALKISISKLYVLLSHYTTALEYATAASLLALQTNHSEDISQCYQLVGSIHFRLKNFEQAIQYFEHSLHTYVERCDFEMIARLSNNIGVAYLDSGNLKKAEEYFTHTLTLSHSLSESYPLGLAYTNRGEIYLKQNSFDKAIVNFFSAIDIYKELQIALCIAYTYLRLSQAYMHKGIFPLALEYAHESTRIQLEMQDQYELSACYLHLSNLYESQNNFKEALNYYKLYSELELNLANNHTKLQVAQLEKDFKEKEESFYKQKTLELENINHELQVAYNQIKELSLTDTLTNLLNRRGFLEHFALYEQDDFFSTSYRSLLLIDIDNFKQINDTYGHLVGDKVLVHTAHILQKIFKDLGIVCRYGGEEFLVLIPKCDLANAHALAKKITSSIKKECISYFSFSYTVTIGLTTSTVHSLEEQIQLADDCLYTGKQGTKDCIICSSIS